MLPPSINRYSQTDLKNTLTKFEVVFQPEHFEVFFQFLIFSTDSKDSPTDLKSELKKVELFSNLKILRLSSKISIF